MELELDLSDFYCLNKNCPDYGKKGKGNIRVKEIYGPKNRALLRCNTCTHCFSETRGTIFFGLKTSDDEILRTLALVPEKGSIRGTARATGHDKDTICRWLDVAGAHCQEITDYFFQELELSQVQIDEIWSYIKKRKKT
jgi:transposase-like protein